MKNIMIITSYIEGSEKEINTLLKEINCDYVICADGGYRYALKAEIKIDLVVGDFDSSDGIVPEFLNTIVVPVEKDDTDLQLALKKAVNLNPEKITIIGGIGGRVDHTLGNIQTIVHYSKYVSFIILLDPFQSITVHLPGTKTYEGDHDTKFSVFAFTDTVKGLTYEGAYYPLKNHTLTNTYPLGISNEFLSDKITVTTSEGILIVVRTKL